MRLLSAIAPTRCPVCETVAEGWCSSCARKLDPSPVLPTPPELQSCRAAFSYNDAARSIVLAVKRRRSHALTGWMADAMLPHIMGGFAIDVVTWPPTDSRRVRERGFDHGELLARSVAQRMGVRVAPLLVRTSSVSSGADRRQRAMVNFDLCGPALRKPSATILLIDDVRTTGATLQAAARALRTWEPSVPRATRIPGIHACTFASTPMQRNRSETSSPWR